MCHFFFCTLLFHIKSSYSVFSFTHILLLSTATVHTPTGTRHPAPVTGTVTVTVAVTVTVTVAVIVTVTGWLQANEMELVLTHYVRARGLEYDSLYGWAEILTPFMSVAMTRGKNDRMHCTLHAAHCTLHATRYTLHPLCKYLDRFYGAHCRPNYSLRPPLLSDSC